MWREWIPFWHAGVSPYGGDVDLLFIGLLFASSLVLGLLFFLLALFCVRYRAGNPVDRDQSRAQELALGGRLDDGLAGLLPGLFVWGASVFFEIYRTPQDELTVFVVAKQWMWKVQHAGGQSEINALHIPVNRPVRLVMASQDVIHSFFIPALRLKHDVVPGRYQDLEIEADRPGHYHLFCAEYCGTDHSGMIGEIVAMEAARLCRVADAAGAVQLTGRRRAARCFANSAAADATASAARCARRRSTASTASRCRLPTAAPSPPTTSIFAIPSCCRAARSPPATSR